MKKGNVIDMAQVAEKKSGRGNDKTGPANRLMNFKMRLDAENAKVAMSASLLSIVVLVTLANNKLISGEMFKSASQEMSASRGIASVSDAQSEVELGMNNALAKELAGRDLSAAASIGRKPSSLDQLAFELLEGKYAVRLHEGKLSEIEFATAETTEAPKDASELFAFLEKHRDLLPAGFDSRVKIGSEKDGQLVTETYQLIDRVSQPVAKLQMRMDMAGRVLAMRVLGTQIASR